MNASVKYWDNQWNKYIYIWIIQIKIVPWYRKKSMCVHIYVCLLFNNLLKNRFPFLENKLSSLISSLACNDQLGTGMDHSCILLQVLSNCVQFMC